MYTAQRQQHLDCEQDERLDDVCPSEPRKRLCQFFASLFFDCCRFSQIIVGLAE